MPRTTPFLAAAVLTAIAAATGLPAFSADPGWNHLRSRAYLPPDFDQEVFDALPTVWEEPAASQAATATPEARRRMAMDRYGLTPDPADPSKPLQYVVAADGSWTMSCLACHQGQLGGRAIPGLPNSNYALETLTEDVRLVKVKQRKPFGHMDMGSLLLPLGTTNGTTNAVMFGVALMRHRNADLEIVHRPPKFDMVHHDMDAPPWWHYAKKKRLYADGFAAKGHRMLMQFLLVKENGPEKFRQWEDEFREIEAWLLSLRPPRWPGRVDAALAERGRAVFGRHCADCHGTYSDAGDTYPGRIVAIDEIGTDRVRFDSLTRENRRDLNDSWFGRGIAGEPGVDDPGWFGRGIAGEPGVDAPAGYVAPPLDGIWATAPYFHNGSVPTLWHLLRPGSRPAVWKRSGDGYDERRVGLEVEERAAMPAGKLPPVERRRHFDTTKPGKSAAGHDYPDLLSEEEKTEVLEYLKTL